MILPTALGLAAAAPLLLLVAPSRVPAASTEATVAVSRPTAVPQRGQKGKSKAKAPDRMTYWDGELDAARTNAKERGVPTVIIAILADEEHNDEMASQIADNKTLAAATERAVVVVVNNGTHSMTKKTFEEDGEKVEREVCSVYHTRNCTVHQRNWDAVYRDYVLAFDPDGEWKLPEVIVLDPNLEIQERLGQGHPPSDSDVVKTIEKVTKKFGLGLTLEELRIVKAALDAGRRMNGAQKWAPAWREWQKALDIVESGPYLEQATEGQAECTQQMGGQLEAVLKLLEPETIRDGYTRLLALETAFADTALLPRVQEALKAAQKDKRFKDAIKELENEAKAREIWAEAQELLRQGDEKKALRVAKKLMGKKYKDTPAAQEALKQFPGLGE